MSRPSRFVCPHCSRNNFRSERGLHQHLLHNRVCSTLEIDKQNAVDTSKGFNIGGLKDPEAMAKGISEMFNEDKCARAQLDGQGGACGGARSGSASNCNNNDLQDETIQDNEEEDFVGQVDDDLDAGTEEDKDQEDEDEEVQGGDNYDQEQGNQVPVSDVSQTQFKQYAETAPTKFCDFTRQQVTSLKLLHTIRKKRATLDAYDAIMEWHLRASGWLQPHQRLGNANGEYISRQTMMERLTRR